VVSYLVPAIGEASVRQRVPGADPTNPFYGYAMDTWLMFSLEMLVVGGVLLVASRAALGQPDPRFHRRLPGADKGHPRRPPLDRQRAPFYLGWFVFHAVVIVTGASALRRAYAEHHSAGSPMTRDEHQLVAAVARVHRSGPRSVFP
jgi:hypothetical protein